MWRIDSFMIYLSKVQEVSMETRVAVISVIVSDENSVEQLNKILHNYGQYIIGRIFIS